MRLLRIGRNAQSDLEAQQDEAAELARRMERVTAPSRRSAIGRIGAVLRRRPINEELWDELEEILIEADLGVPTATFLIERLRAADVAGAAALRARLRDDLIALLGAPDRGDSPAAPGGALWDPEVVRGDRPEPPFPHVVLVVGVNGAGKTTTIAKLAHAYSGEGHDVVIAAADTFRAAAVEQLRHWGERVGAAVIAHAPGADPGAVTYDALDAAVARSAALVLIDTAGRLQTERNLMAELAKVRRVIAGRVQGAPHEVLLVLDANTGRNSLSQARLFREAVGVTAVCLAKLDGSSKGGTVFAVARELGLPVRFVGIGEGLDDLAPFAPAAFVDALLVPASTGTEGGESAGA